jgi:hypothetical protein
MLFKYIPGYYEPTEAEKEISLKRIWYTIVLGLEVEFPTAEERNANKQMKMIIRGLNRYITIEMQKWMKQDDIIFSQEKSRDYLKKFPEMNPTIQRYIKKNDLYIILEWSDYAFHLLHSIPEFGGSLTFDLKNYPNELIGDSLGCY